MRFTPPFVALTLAVAGISFHALAAADPVHAGGRIIQVTPDKKSTHGGRIIHVPPQAAGEARTDGAPVIVTPRYWGGVPVQRLVEEIEDAEEAEAFDDAPPEPPRVEHFVTRTVVFDSYSGSPCYSGGSANFRAGDRFQAGGNLLRVPPEEDRFGRHACNQTRIFQRYLGFKRVYKGQVYTGFNKVYSGRRYLNGNY